jgi:hypothetical protein
MAIIRDVSFDSVLSDIKSVMLNAFTTSGANWYFGYINSSNHAVVKVSSDAGVSWTTAWDFGAGNFIAVTAAKDGDIVATVSSSTLASTTVYKNGTQQAQGSYSSAGAVTLWPVTFFLSTGVGFSSYSDASLGDPVSPNVGQIMPIYGVINYGATNGAYNVVTASTVDSGLFFGQTARTLSNVGIRLSIPGDPHSSLVLQGDQVTHDDWVGFVSTTYSGFLSWTNFGGSSTGGAGVSFFDFSVQNTRGTFFDGYPDGVISVADRGLLATHKTTFSCLIDGTVTCFFIDKNGLFGSTIDDGVLQSVDSSGTLSPFDKAKIYGNTTSTYNSLSFGPADQTGSLTAFVLTANTGETIHSLYRLHDPDPMTRTHAKNTQLLSKVTTVQTVSGTVVDPFDITTSSNALGPARVTGTTPRYGLDLLVQACTEDGVLPNPNSSPGCSPILRELMNQSGVPFSVVREMANDGDSNGHEGGNALDLAGPATSTVLAGASLTDAEYQAMGEICAFLRAVPTLFATVIHYDPVTPSNSLFIWDGKLTTASQFGGISAQIVKDSINNIHVSSSRSRLLAGFKSPVIQAALGTGPGVTDAATGAATSQTVPDLFSTDRYVYVNDDGYVGSPVTGLAVKKEPAQVVNFW